MGAIGNGAPRWLYTAYLVQLSYDVLYDFETQPCVLLRVKLGAESAPLFHFIISQLYERQAKQIHVKDSRKPDRLYKKNKS